MIFCGVPDLRLTKRQSSMCSRRILEDYPYTLYQSTQKSKITSHGKSRPTPHATSPQGKFSTSSSIKTSMHGRNRNLQMRYKQGRIQGGNWGDRPTETYESNVFHHDFVQFGKQHWRCEVILPSIVLS